MADRSSRHGVRCLFSMPSFYGAVTWGAWLVLYALRLIRVDAWSAPAMVLFLGVEALFILSACVFLPYYRDAMEMSDGEDAGGAARVASRSYPSIKTVLLLMHTAGFSGLALYVVEFSRNLGGLAGFFLALVNEAYAIRWEAETSASIGIQLTYFGWIAISLTVYQYAGRRISWPWLLPALLQLLGNLMFIDRTRPFWIFFTTVLTVFSHVKDISIRKLARWTIVSSIVAFAMFWLVAEWTGKTAYEGKYENSVLPGITQEIYAYGISGFAYFNRMLESNEQLSYVPGRVLYPMYKYLARFGLVTEPPSQVIDFYDVPFSTNVGTFLEPFYRDGGLLFMVCGMILYSFGLDALGLHLLRSRRPLAIYAWSNLCFVTFIGFFTPKLSSFPIWLFVIFGVANAALGMTKPAARERQAAT